MCGFMAFRIILSHYCPGNQSGTDMTALAPLRKSSWYPPRRSFTLVLLVLLVLLEAGLGRTLAELLQEVVRVEVAATGKALSLNPFAR
jgi:hypothetical protein